MNEPNISWYILNENNEELPPEDFYAGNYKYGEYLDLDIRLWNNRWGDEDIQSAKNIIFEISFANIEDSIMFRQLEVKEHGIPLKGFEDGNTMKFRLKKELSGSKHSMNESENIKNFVDINLQILVEHGLKRSIKNMIVSVDYDRGDN